MYETLRNAYGTLKAHALILSIQVRFLNRKCGLKEEVIRLQGLQQLGDHADASSIPVNTHALTHEGRERRLSLSLPPSLSLSLSLSEKTRDLSLSLPPPFCIYALSRERIVACTYACL